MLDDRRSNLKQWRHYQSALCRGHCRLRYQAMSAGEENRNTFPFTRSAANLLFEKRSPARIKACGSYVLIRLLKPIPKYLQIRRKAFLAASSPSSRSAQMVSVDISFFSNCSLDAEQTAPWSISSTIISMSLFTEITVSKQPLLPQAHLGPFGSIIVCPIWPAAPELPAQMCPSCTGQQAIPFPR